MGSGLAVRWSPSRRLLDWLPLVWPWGPPPLASLSRPYSAGRLCPLDGCHVLRPDCCDTSLTLFFRPKGLWFWKKPLFFLISLASGGGAAAAAAGGATGAYSLLTGEVLPLGGSWLEKDVGFEYSLWESRLEGLSDDGALLRSDPVGRRSAAVGREGRQSMVMPSSG
ncbi:hypothetical protein VTK73DRAFT_2000 [Phialemonium thermophilum]|uniref:Uncharacterized protein n=1 Tax=Phialemonium thermophilum TaxID=223376 RepID=A0ABR3VSP5_9PEZI